MESFYAMAAGIELLVILALVGIIAGQRATILEYRRDYLSRSATQKYART